jgi:hypothetical protein
MENSIKKDVILGFIFSLNGLKLNENGLFKVVKNNNRKRDIFLESDEFLILKLLNIDFNEYTEAYSKGENEIFKLLSESKYASNDKVLKYKKKAKSYFLNEYIEYVIKNFSNKTFNCIPLRTVEVSKTLGIDILKIVEETKYVFDNFLTEKKRKINPDFIRSFKSDYKNQQMEKDLKSFALNFHDDYDFINFIVKSSDSKFAELYLKNY